MFSRSASRYFLAATVLLLTLTRCAAPMGVGRISHVDKGAVWPVVQVLPNYRFSPECNVDFCAVLFTRGGSDLYAPKVENAGGGKPSDFDLRRLVPYQISDGSILYAPLGSDPYEYKTASGEIRIRFGFDPEREIWEGGPSGGRS